MLDRKKSLLNQSGSAMQVFNLQCFSFNGAGEAINYLVGTLKSYTVASFGGSIYTLNTKWLSSECLHLFTIHKAQRNRLLMSHNELLAYYLLSTSPGCNSQQTLLKSLWSLPVNKSRRIMNSKQTFIFIGHKRSTIKYLYIYKVK